MPYSAEEGKEWVVETVRNLQPSPASVLDVGPGAGTYARLLRPTLPDATFTAVEVYEPYVQRFGLASLYDSVVVADVRDWDWDRSPHALVVFGDVLEHLPYGAALQVWRNARRTSDYLIASLPTSERWWHQEPENGNQHERHHFAWTYELFSKLPGVVDSRHGQDVSVFLAEGVKTRERRRGRSRAVS